MASSDARRRKQLEKKKKKRSERQHQIAIRQNAGLAEQLRYRSKAPIHECLVSPALQSQGLGELIISRRCSSGEIAFGQFLIDRYCMGVKDCFGRISTKADFDAMLKQREDRGLELHAIDPASARRLIDDAVAFAGQFGLRPHNDFRSARMILGDIDPTQATQFFEMGLNGKPYFIAGPHQSTAECRRIIEKLQAATGEGNFDYTMGISSTHPLISETEMDELMFDDDGDLDDGDFDDDDEQLTPDDDTESAVDVPGSRYGISRPSVTVMYPEKSRPRE